MLTPAEVQASALSLIHDAYRRGSSRTYAVNSDYTAIGVEEFGRFRRCAMLTVDGRWCEAGYLLVNGKPLVPPTEVWIPIHKA